MKTFIENVITFVVGLIIICCFLAPVIFWSYVINLHMETKKAEKRKQTEFYEKATKYLDSVSTTKPIKQI